MSKSKNITETNTYPEINEIREDLDSLKNNVIELTRHMRKDGKAHTEELKGTLMERLTDMKTTGSEQYRNVETRIKQKPAQSIAIAFAAGLAASLLLGRR